MIIIATPKNHIHLNSESFLVLYTSTAIINIDTIDAIEIKSKNLYKSPTKIGYPKARTTIAIWISIKMSASLKKFIMFLNNFILTFLSSFYKEIEFDGI